MTDFMDDEQTTRRGSRTSRKQSEREMNPVHEESSTPWKQELLQTAPPPPPGWHYRWVRVLMNTGKEDLKNISKRVREGYEPVKPEELPSNYVVGKMDHGRFAGYVASGFSVLMKIPASKIAERTRQMAKMRQMRTDLMNQELAAAGSKIGTKAVKQHRQEVVMHDPDLVD